MSVEAPQGCAGCPCASCPYRQDVPSGVWDRTEYERLPRFDGSIIDQLYAGAFNLFGCHLNDGRLCAGWIATHGADNLLAVRMAGAGVDPAVFEFVSPVPVFASGQEACAHGLRDIDRPGREAQRAIARLSRKGAR